MAGPLARLRVVDLTQVLSGPFTTMLLADLGADVVKVEPPAGDVARLWGPDLRGLLRQRQPQQAQHLPQLAGRIPCGPVNSAADIARDPHVRARAMIVEVEHPAGGTVGVAGTPIKFSGTPAGPLRRAPLLGEHTAEVLAELTRPGLD